MADLIIYGDRISGNCLKVKYVADLLGLSYDWVEVDVVAGDARKPEFARKNPAMQVPFVELPDGRALSQSNAIMLFLAQGSNLIPVDAYEAALMDQWLFWEQYSHETAIAVARFKVKFMGTAIADLPIELVEKGNRALDLMEDHLQMEDYFVGPNLTLADIALFAYTQWADEGGFSLNERPNTQAWLERVEGQLGLSRLPPRLGKEQ